MCRHFDAGGKHCVPRLKPGYGRAAYVYRNAAAGQYDDDDDAPIGGPYVPPPPPGAVPAGRQFGDLPPQPPPPSLNGVPFARTPADVSSAPSDDVTGTVRAPVAAAPDPSGLKQETLAVSDMPDSPAAEMKKT